MKRIRSTEITLETTRVLEVMSRPLAVRRWCAGCGGEVQMVSPDTAAVATGLTTRSIYRLVEAAEIHFAETEGRQIVICLNSLQKS